MREGDGDVEGLVDEERDVGGGGEGVGTDCQKPRNERRTKARSEVRDGRREG